MTALYLICGRAINKAYWPPHYLEVKLHKEENLDPATG